MRRGTFNLGHHHLLSGDMGQLIPTTAIEVLPGDTFRGATSALVRVAPLVSPLMHPVDVRLHTWFVPNRLLWGLWDEWITGNSLADGQSPPTYTLTSDADELALADHLGIPPQVGLTVSAFPFMAYSLIWDEFYRDQDLQARQGTTIKTLQRIAWEKDYFTVARSQAATGADISIPFESQQISVEGLGRRTTDGTSTETYVETATGETITGQAAYKSSDDVFFIPDTGAYVDLAGLSGGIDINDFRRAMALQRFAEARARFGDRYADYLRFLGVNPSDGRLDRPEYVGGGKQTISFSEVLATAEGTNTAVGDMFGHGLAAIRTRRFQKMFEEHGWVIQVMSVRPKTMYQDAVPRKFLRTDNMDYWQKELEVEPWQAIYQNEVHHAGSSSTIFGWQNKHQEYREELSYVSGTFRGGTEDHWHMARTFASPPTLNESFIQCTPTDRVYADTSMPEILCNVRHDIMARRLVRQHASI